MTVRPFTRQSEEAADSFTNLTERFLKNCLLSRGAYHMLASNAD